MSQCRDTCATEMNGREHHLQERGVRALERLVTLFENQAEEQVEDGAPPSVCPFCDTENPIVAETKMGVGPVDEFVLVGETECCNRTVYAVPVQMLIAPTIEIAEAAMKIKKGG
jgi:hypothetical protein